MFIENVISSKVTPDINVDESVLAFSVEIRSTFNYHPIFAVSMGGQHSLDRLLSIWLRSRAESVVWSLYT